jgi:anti-sigma factor RsiW
VSAITCREFIMDLLIDYAESILGPAAIGDVERHLTACGPCRAYLATYQRIARLTGVAAAAEMPEEMMARLRETLLRALNSELEAQPGLGAAPSPPDARP